MKAILQIVLAFVTIGNIWAKSQKNVVEVCGLDMVKGAKNDWKSLSKVKKSQREDEVMGDDVVLTPEQKQAKSKKGKDGSRRTVSRGNTVYWPTDQPIYYSLDTDNMIDPLKENIEKAIEVIEQYTCIKFTEVPKNDQNRYHINFVRAGSAQSNIGKTQGTFGSSRYFQLVKLPGYMTVGGIIHEIMHAFGFIHEQERPDRDEYIDINRGNIQPGKEPNFAKEDDANTFGEDYDFNSIMHYGANFMGKTVKQVGEDGKDKFVKLITIVAKEAYGGEARDIGSKGSLTDSDIRRLNKLFMCAEPNAQQMQEAQVVLDSRKPEELIEESKEGDFPKGPCEKERQLHKND
ncbi:nematocyst expressed protein 6-like [Rhopilema esculentum]|uniref:nematocyst expressed protein 6-like n=1 Tax=Rhopilema esculentum TaxID=499914 RepID=UPI0031CFE1DF|eukprot:gene1686-16163_t